MSERVEGFRISVEVNTNKRDVMEHFESIDEFIRWWNEHEDLHGRESLILDEPHSERDLIT